MVSTVTLPGVGPVKKPVLIGGLVILAVILGVAYYRHSRAAGQQAAADASRTPDPNAVDPNTGLTYGEEAAGVQAGDGTGTGDNSGIVGYAQGNPIYSDQAGYGPAPTFLNNADWAQAVEQYLTSATGANPATVAAAIGAYLSGQPLTQAQAVVVRSATGFFGAPPVSGPGGFPPSLRTVPPSPGGTGGPGGQGAAPKSPPGGVTFTARAGHADASWVPVDGATKYEVLIVGAGGKGSGTSHVDHVTFAHGKWSGIKLARGSYRGAIRAGNDAGWGPYSTVKTFTVKG